MSMLLELLNPTTDVGIRLQMGYTEACTAVRAVPVLLVQAQCSKSDCVTEVSWPNPSGCCHWLLEFFTAVQTCSVKLDLMLFSLTS